MGQSMSKLIKQTDVSACLNGFVDEVLGDVTALRNRINNPLPFLSRPEAFFLGYIAGLGDLLNAAFTGPDSRLSSLRSCILSHRLRQRPDVRIRCGRHRLRMHVPSDSEGCPTGLDSGVKIVRHLDENYSLVENLDGVRSIICSKLFR